MGKGPAINFGDDDVGLLPAERHPSATVALTAQTFLPPIAVHLPRDLRRRRPLHA